MNFPIKKHDFRMVIVEMMNRNPKSEIRSTKQFRNSNLFWISIFGLRIFVLAFGLLFSPPTNAGLLDTNDPGLKQVVSSVAFHVSFDDETCDADLSVGEPKPIITGTPVFVDGISGKAVKRVNLRYPTEKNLQLDKPGSLSMWVLWLSKPEPSPEGVAASWWMTEYSGNGYIGFEPRGEKTGMLWCHYFQESRQPEQHFPLRLEV